MTRFPAAPPLSGEPRPWSFPRTVVQDLSNGLRIVAINSGSLPIAQVRWVFGSGRIHEARNRLGSGLILQRAMRHGTKDLSARAFAETLDRLGARMAGGVTIDSSIVSISGVSQHLWRFLDLATDVALQPALPGVAAAAERLKAIQIHRHEWGQVENAVALWLARSLYGEHPYGLPRTTESGLRQTSVEDLLALHQSIVDPHHGLLLVVGKVDVDSVVQRMAVRFGSMRFETRPNLTAPPSFQPRRKTVVMIPMKSAKTTAIGLGLNAVARSSPEYTPLRIVNQVFGGSASSRLFRSLRDERGLCYGAFSALDCGRLGGDLTAVINLAPERACEGFSALYGELEKMAHGQITPEELSHAQRFLVGSFPQRTSGLAGLATLATASWMHNLPDDVWSTAQVRLNAVTLAQANDCSARYLRPDQATWVVAGRPDGLTRLEDVAKKMGLEIVYQTMEDLENTFG